MKQKHFTIAAVKGWQLAVCCVIFMVLVLFMMVQIYHRTVRPTAGTDIETPGRIAIVIDDFGRQRKGVREMLDLDVKLTAAVIPFLEHSADDAQYAADHGKEVIIHLPMQATTHDKPDHLGPRPIKVGQSPEEITKILTDAKAELPQAVGANIHMGTLASSTESVVRPIMKYLKANDMYFVDSMTSGKSVCKPMAAEADVKFLQNGNFLEHEQKNKPYVKKQLQKGIEIAKKNGRCIVIGHVGVEGGMITVEAISEMKKTFEDNHIELVYVSELFE